MDEIGNMPLEMQAKLLRVLQEGTFTKVGGTKRIPTDVRVIAATNTDLRDAVGQGRFREDLYYRLNVVNIEIPPLRNIRQLQNVVERLLIFADHNKITEKDIPYEITKQCDTCADKAESKKLEDIIVEHIKTVLAEENGNVSKAAEVLGVTRATIYKRLKGQA